MGLYYDRERSFEENCKGESEHSSLPRVILPDKMPMTHFLGKALKTPLGIAACPIMYAGGIRYYVRLGYSYFTYHTIRTTPSKAYSKPNIKFLKAFQLIQPNDLEDFFVCELSKTPTSTWASSFGEPCLALQWYTKDIKAAKLYLNHNQLLVVSVCGDGMTANLARQDWCRLVYHAKACGADMIEINLAPPLAPNSRRLLHFRDGEFKAILAAIVALAAPLPVIAKMPYYPDLTFIENRMYHLSEAGVQAIALIHGVPLRLYDENAVSIFGETRESACVTGHALYDLMRVYFEKIVEINQKKHFKFSFVVSGGIDSPARIKRMLSLGANVVTAATSVMRDPMWAMNYIEEKKYGQTNTDHSTAVY